MEAWDKDGEKERAEEEQDAGREEDDMTGDGKVEWHGNGEVKKKAGSEEKVDWGREVEKKGAEEEQDAGRGADEMAAGDEVWLV